MSSLSRLPHLLIVIPAAENDLSLDTDEAITAR